MHEQTGHGDVECSVASALFHIPTEVCENIIDMLYSNNASGTIKDIAALQSCSLVSRSWRVRAQRMLFYKVQLFDVTSLHRLSIVLDAGQHLRGYVHEISLLGHYQQTTASIVATFAAVFAGKLPSLRSIDIGQLQERDTWWYPRRSDPPKAKPLPYIPLHPCIANCLSCFKAVNALLLYSTTFHSFNDLARMLRGLPNLETLVCNSVRWISPGGFYPAHFTGQPGRDIEKSAPKLRKLWLNDVVAYGANKLLSTHRPHLTWLGMTIPLSVSNREESAYHPTIVEEIDLDACSGLRTLRFSISPEFLTHSTSVGQLKSILDSWKPRHVKPFLYLCPFNHSRFTRQDFSDVLSTIGATIDSWLQTVEPPAGGTERSWLGVKYQLVVEIHDWEAERKRWSDHVSDCFPTWMRFGELHMDFDTPLNRHWEWKQETTEEQQPHCTTGEPSSQYATASQSSLEESKLSSSEAR